MFKNLFKSIQSTIDFIPKTLGFVSDKLIDIADIVLPIFDPAIKTLAPIPVVGPVVGDILVTVENVMTRSSTELHNIADQLSTGSLINTADALVDGITHVAGNSLTSLSFVGHSLIDAPQPIVNLLDDLPIIGDILNATIDTAHNTADFINTVGGLIERTDLPQVGAKLILDPLVALGELIEEKSELSGELLDVIDPILDLTNSIPVLSQSVDLIDKLSDAALQTLHDTGTVLKNYSTGVELSDLPFFG